MLHHFPRGLSVSYPDIVSRLKLWKFFCSVPGVMILFLTFFETIIFFFQTIEVHHFWFPSLSNLRKSCPQIPTHEQLSRTLAML